MFRKDLEYTFTLDEFPDYEINTSGVVYDTKRKRWLRIQVNRGYEYFLLRNRLGYSRRVAFHRLIAMQFHHTEDDIKDMEVNHIDGVKNNNHWANLEWCTSSQNKHHAGRLRLTRKCRPMFLIDTESPDFKTLEFVSAKECADFLEVTKDLVNYRVKFGSERIFPDGYMYVYREDLEESLIRLRKNGANNKFGRKVKVLVRNVDTNVITEYLSLSDVLEDFDFSMSSLWAILDRNKQEIIFDKYQFKFDNNNPWREIDDVVIERYKSGKGKAIVLEDESGVRRYFKSSLACSKEMGIGITTINYRLKSRGKTRYSDGFTYDYL